MNQYYQLIHHVPKENWGKETGSPLLAPIAPMQIVLAIYGFLIILVGYGTYSKMSWDCDGKDVSQKRQDDHLCFHLVHAQSKPKVQLVRKINTAILFVLLIMITVIGKGGDHRKMMNYLGAALIAFQQALQGAWDVFAPDKNALRPGQVKKLRAYLAKKSKKGDLQHA